MLFLIQNHAILLLCSILSLFSCNIAFSENKSAVFLNIGQGLAPANFRSMVIAPAGILMLKQNGNHSVLKKFLHYALITVFFVLSFCFVWQLTTSLMISLLLFLPLTVLYLAMVYYVLWAAAIWIHRIVDIGHIGLNALFSFLLINILLIWLGLEYAMSHQISSFGFYLTVGNLSLCYLFVLYALKLMLEDAQAQLRTLTYDNLWKMTLMIIIDFLFVLSLLCYTIYVYIPDAYSLGSSTILLFDFFYYVVVTFGTVGYGDIIPTCVYSKCVAILIIFTSITCITIMLSIILSLPKEKDG